MCFAAFRTDMKCAVGKDFYGYMEEFIEQFERIYANLGDEYSKQIFKQVLDFRLKYFEIESREGAEYPLPKEVYLERMNNKRKREAFYFRYFKNIPNKEFINLLSENAYSYKDFISCKGKKVIIDAGAANGDSAAMFSLLEPSSTIYAFEPIDSFYKELLELGRFFTNVIPVKAGLSDVTKEIVFHQSSLYQFTINETDKQVYSNSEKGLVYSLDDFVAKKKLQHIDLIKMDIEGAEMSALQGAKKTIESFSPDLAICIYHSERDMWEIIRWINGNFPDYKIYVDHELKKNFSGTVCYATKNDEHLLKEQTIQDLFYSLKFEQIISQKERYLQNGNIENLFYVAYAYKESDNKKLYLKYIFKYIEKASKTSINYILSILNLYFN